MPQFNNILPHRGKRPFLIKRQGTNKRNGVKYFPGRNVTEDSQKIKEDRLSGKRGE